MISKYMSRPIPRMILWFISTVVASTMAGCLLFLLYEAPFSQSKNAEINILRQELQEHKKLSQQQAEVVIIQGERNVDMEAFIERVENFYEKRLNTLLAIFGGIITVVGFALPIVSMFLQDNNYKENMSVIADMNERAKDNEKNMQMLLNKYKLQFSIAWNARKQAKTACDNADVAIKSLQDNTKKFEEQFQQLYSDWHAQNAANYNGLARTFMDLYKADQSDIHVKNAIIYLLMAIKFNIKAHKADGIYLNIDFLDKIFSHNTDIIKKYKKPLSTFSAATVDDIKSIVNDELDPEHIEKYESILSQISNA